MSIVHHLSHFSCTTSITTIHNTFKNTNNTNNTNNNNNNNNNNKRRDTRLPIAAADAASCSILGYDSENTRQKALLGVLPILVRIMYSRSTLSAAKVSEYIPRSNTDCAIC